MDATSAAVFYGGLFGWRADETFTLDGWAVAGLRSGAPGQPAGWLTYLSTEDVSVSAAAVAAAGGTVLLAPTEVGPRGRTAVCADASGAVFALWQRGTFAGAELINEPATVCWSEVLSRDEAVAADFYGRAFGWSKRPGELAEGLAYTEWTLDGRVLAGLTVMDERYPVEVPPHWRTTFAVDDCVATAARCAELGGMVVLAPMDVVVGTYAQIVDPQGGSFGVIELAPQFRGMF